MVYALFYINILIFNVNLEMMDKVITLNVRNSLRSDTKILEDDNKDLTYEDYISFKQ